jgi:hypothetical protein
MRRTRNRRRSRERFDAYLEHLNDFDEDRNRWQGTCLRCGTSHDGWPPDTIGGLYRCRRTRAQHRADNTTWLPVAWYARWRVKRNTRLIERREQAPRP